MGVAERPTRRVRAARVVTEALAPQVLAVVVPVVVGAATAASAVRGAGLGALAAVFSGGVPHLVVALGVSLWWKVSLHAAVAAGSVAVMVAVLGPWALALGALAVATAWSRVVLGVHTVAQVVVGAGVGAVVAAGVMALA